MEKEKLELLQKTKQASEIEAAKKEVMKWLQQHPELNTGDMKQVLLYSCLMYGKDEIEREIRNVYNPPIMAKEFNFDAGKMLIMVLQNKVRKQDFMKPIYLLSIRQAGKKDPITNKQDKRMVSFWAVNEKKIGSSWVNEDMAHRIDGLPSGMYSTRYNITKDDKAVLSSPIELHKIPENGFSVGDIMDGVMKQYPKLEPPYQPFFGEDGKKIPTVHFYGMLLLSPDGRGYVLNDGKNDDQIRIYAPQGSKMEIREQDYFFGVGSLQPLKEGEDAYRLYSEYMVLMGRAQ
jgi:hypothetical protein